MAPRGKAKPLKPQRTLVKVIFKGFLIFIYEFIPNRFSIVHAYVTDLISYAHDK